MQFCAQDRNLRCLLRPVRDCIGKLFEPSTLDAEPDMLAAVVASVLSGCLLKAEKGLAMIGRPANRPREGKKKIQGGEREKLPETGDFHRQVESFVWRRGRGGGSKNQNDMRCIVI